MRFLFTVWSPTGSLLVGSVRQDLGTQWISNRDPKATSSRGHLSRCAGVCAGHCCVPASGPTAVTALAALCCALAASCVLIWAVVSLPGRGAASERLRAGDSAGSGGPSVRDDVWPGPLNHCAPERQLTVAEAHRFMQLHRECDRATCARKGAAWRTLVAAKRIAPDVSRIQ